MDQGSNRIVIRKTKPAFSKEQKVGLALVVGVGALSVLMGAFYVGGHLTHAFDFEYDGPAVLTHEQEQAQALLELQTTDSDGDGLTDYEELYLYRTGPYLTDTDGDGIDDSAEVLAGTDPSCAPNAPCAQAVVSNPVATNPVESDLELLPSSVQDANEMTVIFEELISGVTAEQVRGFLIENGVSPEAVNELSDEELLQLYQETLIDLQESGQLEEILEEQQVAE